jgi:hypothetical protein
MKAQLPLGGSLLDVAQRLAERRLVREILGEPGRKRRRRGDILREAFLEGKRPQPSSDWGLSALGRSMVRGRVPSLMDNIIAPPRDRGRRRG